MSTPTEPDHVGQHDECATCGHLRWRHKTVDGQTVCTEYVDCACRGVFVELSYGTRMSRMAEAAHSLAGTIATMRDALRDAMVAANRLHTAMRDAGLLPEPEQSTAHAAGRHHLDKAALAKALDVPPELLDGPTPDTQTHRWPAAPLAGDHDHGPHCVRYGCPYPEETDTP